MPHILTIQAGIITSLSAFDGSLPGKKMRIMNTELHPNTYQFIDLHC